MEITRNLLLHQWYYNTKRPTVEDTIKFKNLIDVYGTQKVFDAIAFSHFMRELGVFASIRNHTEKEFMEAPEKIKAAYSQEEFGKAKQEFYNSMLKSYNSRVYKNGEYAIVALPKDDSSGFIDWIRETDRVRSRKNYEYEIRIDTVLNIPFGFPIRRNAVDFTRCWENDRVYAVFFYGEKCELTCLFLIKYTFGKKIHCSISRCIGKKRVKYHWVPIKKYVEEHKEYILSHDGFRFSIDW